MNAQEILTLAEAVAISVQNEEIPLDYHAIEQEMIRRLWSLTAEQQNNVVRLARRGRIPTSPAEQAVMVDSPEWAATVRIVFNMATLAKRNVEQAALDDDREPIQAGDYRYYQPK